MANPETVLNGFWQSLIRKITWLKITWLKPGANEINCLARLSTLQRDQE